MTIKITDNPYRIRTLTSITEVLSRSHVKYQVKLSSKMITQSQNAVIIRNNKENIQQHKLFYLTGSENYHRKMKRNYHKKRIIR